MTSRLPAVLFLVLAAAPPALAQLPWVETMDDVGDWGRHNGTFDALGNGTARQAKTGAAPSTRVWAHAGKVDVSRHRFLRIRVVELSGTVRVALSGPSGAAHTPYIVTSAPGEFVADVSSWSGQTPGGGSTYVTLDLSGPAASAVYDVVAFGEFQAGRGIVFDRLRGLNYVLPTRYAMMFWQRWAEEAHLADRDLGQAAALFGARLNRIFIPYTAFGTRPTLAQVDEYLALHRKHGLRAIVTLFDADFFSGACPAYQPQCYDAHKAYLDTIVGHLRDDPIVFAWDLKNEMDVDYKPVGAAVCNAWAREMIAHLRRLDADTPITIGYCGGSCADEGRVEDATNTFAQTLDVVDFVSMRFDGQVERAVVEQLDNIYRQTSKSVLMEEFGIHSAALTNKTEAAQLQWYKEVVAGMDARQLPTRPFPTLVWTLNDLDPSLGPVEGFPEFKAHEKHLGLLSYPDQRRKPAATFLRHHDTVGPRWRENFDSPAGWTAEGAALVSRPGAIAVVPAAGGPGRLELTDPIRRLPIDRARAHELTVVAYQMVEGAIRTFDTSSGPDFTMTFTQYDASGSPLGELADPLIDSRTRQSHAVVWFVDLSKVPWEPNARFAAPVFTVFPDDVSAPPLILDLLQVDVSPPAPPAPPWEPFVNADRWNDPSWGGDAGLAVTPSGRGGHYRLERPDWGYNDSPLLFPRRIVDALTVDVHEMAPPNSYGVALREWDVSGAGRPIREPLFEYHQFSGPRTVDLRSIDFGDTHWIAPRLMYAGGPGEIFFRSVDLTFREEALVAAGADGPYVLERGRRRRIGGDDAFTTYGYPAADILHMHGASLASIPLGTALPKAAFVDRFDPLRPGWRDALHDPTFAARLTDNGDGTALLATTPGRSWGKALSPILTVDVDRFPVAELRVAGADPGAFVELNIQQETSPWAHYRLIGGRYGPSRRAADLRRATGWTGTQTFSIEVLVVGAGKGVRLDAVLLRGGDSDPAGFLDHFQPPGTWRDVRLEPGFGARLTDNGDGTARLTREAGAVWGKVLTERMVVDPSETPVVSFAVEYVQPGSHVELNVQLQESANYTHYRLLGGIRRPGRYTADLRSLGLAGRRTLSLELIIAGGSTSRESIAIVDEVSLLAP